jgi:oligopeptide transport system substrate-binding protein
MRPQRKLGLQFLGTLLCLVAITALAACGGGPAQTGQPTKAPANQQVLRSPDTVSDIPTLDPGQSTDLYSIGAVDLVFTGLVAENDQLQVVPQLAHDYNVSSDGLTWTFHLRPNLQFSDGTSLTSQDVVYSIDRALSPTIYNLNGISLTYLGLIKGATERTEGKIPTMIGPGLGLEAPNPSTVIIHVTQPTAYFLEALTYPASYVVEKKVIDQWGLKWTDHLSEGGGDGPFKVQEYNHSTGITFVPNPNYYGKKPQLQKYQVSFINDTETNYLEYQSNQADITGIPTQDNTQAATLKDQYHKVPLLAINYFGLNYLVKPLDNIKIREALDLAINKDLIVQHVFKGQAIPTNHIIPKGMPGYNATLTGPDGVAATAGDTTKAKQLFTAGLQEEGITLAQFPRLTFTYSSTHQTVADEVTTVIQMWQSVLGITTIVPNPVDTSTLFKDISNTTNNTSLDIWAVDWYADYPDPQDWITLQYDKGEADNNINYGQNHSTDATQQQALQQQMEQADAMQDQTARMKLYNQIEQQLVNDVAWLPMQQVISTYLMKPYVIGVVDNSQGLTPPDDWGNVYIAKH